MAKPINTLPLVKGGIPLLGNIHQLKPDQLHLILEDWARQYGEFYRLKVFGNDVVVVCDHELITQMLKNRLKPYNRPDNFVQTLKELKIDSLFTNDVDDWAKQRDLVTKSMNINKLRRAYETFEDITGVLMSIWEKKSREGNDFSLIIDVRKYTFDMLCAISFGYKSGTLTDEGGQFFHAMDKIFEVMNKGAQAPFALWRHFHTKYDKDAVNSVSLVVSKIEEIIRKNIDGDEGNNSDYIDCNILATLISENHSNGGTLDHNQIVGNVFALIGAGFHTVGNTISWLSYNLAVQKDIQERVHQEIIDCLRDNGNPEAFSYFDKLPVMNAFIKESMRVRPSAPLIFITTTEDVELGGVAIPADTDIYAHNGYLSRCDKHFRRADEFDVERWLDKTLTKSEHNEKAYMPFSNGSTFCPGRNLAFLQIQMYLFNMCKNFKISLSAKTKDVQEFYHIGVDPSDIFVHVEKRNAIDSVKHDDKYVSDFSQSNSALFAVSQ